MDAGIERPRPFLPLRTTFVASLGSLEILLTGLGFMGRGDDRFHLVAGSTALVPEEGV